MGCCLSKKDPSSTTFSGSIPPNEPKKNPSFCIAQMESKKIAAAIEAEKTQKKPEQHKEEEEKPVKKKEVFVIQHRKSNDRRPESSKCPSSDGSDPCGPISPDPSSSDGGINKQGVDRGIAAGSSSSSSLLAGGAAVVRTSSCTKEEVDAILIQCGRLSRSCSGKGTTPIPPCENRKYAGSKRSHDFDSECVVVGVGVGGGSEDPKRKVGCDSDNCDDEEEHRRRRESRGSHRRRRTPSRSRERDSQQQQQMSSGRRVSRSPGRRSESPIVSSSNRGNGNGNASGNIGDGGRPGKMISVPATVSSLSNDTTTNGHGNVKRILVKRNVGEGGAAAAGAGSRGTASPRSQSPARGNGIGGGKVPNESNNQQQVQSLDSSSRKAEHSHSPYRRTPLNEIDMNSLPMPFQPLANKPKNNDIDDQLLVGALTVKQHSHTPAYQKKCVVDTSTVKVVSQGTHRRSGSRGAGEGNEMANINYCLVTDSSSALDKGEQLKCDAIVTPVIISDTLRLPPQTLTRSRSSRRSRDLDINVEALLNPNPTSNYNSLLLQDIQNFHHQNTNNNTNICTPFKLPPCLSKACSILEAVADLNSSTSSNLLSGAFANNDKLLKSTLSNGKDDENNNNLCFSSANAAAGKRRLLEAAKDPPPFVVESQVNVGDDLMAPSIHKYVTVRKKGVDDEEQESSGSNSFVGSQQLNWTSPSSWEPNSADSTDCWTSSNNTTNNTKGGGGGEGSSSSQLDLERLHRNDDRKLSKNRRESSSSEPRNGTMNARAGNNGKAGPHTVASSMAAALAAAST
ncbi:hypothetical protein Dimus_012409 [Dionaea muscipula]